MSRSRHRRGKGQRPLPQRDLAMAGTVGAVRQPARLPEPATGDGVVAAASARRDWLWPGVLALLYLVTRLPGLALAGPNYDEATYLYWGQVIGADWAQRYIGAGWGGKQPLHAWLVALSEKLFQDPVFAGRVASVVAGALTLAALWLLARRLFSHRVAIVAAVLYIACPFTLLFDRQALIDSLLAAEALWMILLSVRLLDRQRAPGVVGLGLAFGAALLTKSVAQAFPLLLPASLLALEPGEIDRRRLGRWLRATVAGLLGGFVIYYVAFGGSSAARSVSQFEQQYGRYSMSLSQVLALPWSQWGNNVASVLRWFGQLITIPLSLGMVAAVLALPWLGRRAWLLGAWAILPIVGHVAIATVFYQRYILFAIPPALILFARLCEWAFGRLSRWGAIAGRMVLGRPVAPVLGIAMLALLLLLPAAQDVPLLTDVLVTNRAIGGYYGLWAMRDYLVERAQANPLVVIVNYSPAPVEDGSAALLRDVSRVKVLRVAPMDGKLTIFDPATQQMYPAEQLAGQDVYYANQNGAESNSWLAGRLELVQQFPNQLGDGSYVGLYRILFDEGFR